MTDTATLEIVEAAFRALADATDDCVFLTDRRGRYVAVNRSFARWVGRPEEEILGRTASDMWPPAQEEGESADPLVVPNNGPAALDERRPAGAGSRTVRTVHMPVRDQAGAVRGVLGLFRDVTDEAAREDPPREAAPLEMVGQLAGGVAHDFNNLMTAVLGHVALLRDGIAPQDPHQTLLAAVERAANHASDLSRRVLACLRHEAPRRVPVDLNGLVEQITGLLRRTIDPRIQVVVHLCPTLPRPEADATQLTQLLLNLCLNARDAMPRGGRLRVETAVDVIDAGRARLHPQRRPGEFVRLRVADTGEGMPPAVRARLFEWLFTTKPPGQGQGIGLTIVQQVVQAHRGWIECLSIPGEGTCFDVFLPLAAASAAAAG